METLLVADEDESEEDEELEPAPLAVALKTNGDVPGRLLYWNHIYKNSCLLENSGTHANAHLCDGWMIANIVQQFLTRIYFAIFICRWEKSCISCNN